MRYRPEQGFDSRNTACLPPCTLIPHSFAPHLFLHLWLIFIAIRISNFLSKTPFTILPLPHIYGQAPSKKEFWCQFLSFTFPRYEFNWSLLTPEIIPSSVLFPGRTNSIDTNNALHVSRYNTSKPRAVS